MQTTRIHGLDILRSVAIILVFMFHCFGGSIGRAGWVGVDLFFVLSGYLIGNQIFSILNKQQSFSLNTFYCRRFLRTLPNYLFVLGLYFLIPAFREQPLLTPLWKFITFTQNFGLSHSAFSHAWSLCLEEQFYLFLPIIVLFIANKRSLKTGWILVGIILLGGIILRTTLWFTYIQHVGKDTFQLYMTKIYYFPFCRLDGLVLGVTIAMLQNYYMDIWSRIIARANWFLVLGLIGCYFTFYPLSYLFEFVPTAFGFLLRSVSFAALVLAALSPNTLLHRIKIPGTMKLAAWSYAIYLTHKQVIHITHSVMAYWSIGELSIITIVIEILISLGAGWLLYTYIETPFLKLRHKLVKINFVDGIVISDEINKGSVGNTTTKATINGAYPKETNPA